MTINTIDPNIYAAGVVVVMAVLGFALSMILEPIQKWIVDTFIFRRK